MAPHMPNVYYGALQMHLVRIFRVQLSRLNGTASAEHIKQQKSQLWRIKMVNQVYRMEFIPKKKNNQDDVMKYFVFIK